MKIELDGGEVYNFAFARIKQICRNNAEITEKAAEIYEDGMFSPRAKIRETEFDGSTKIRLCGGEINCPVLGRLRGIEKIYAYILTVGEAPQSERLVESGFADMWGTAFCDGACAALREETEKLNRGMYVSEPFGPGFYGIGTETIEWIYNYLDCGEIGVELENGFLKPSKSSVGFFAVCSEKINTEFTDCMSCRGDTNCELCKNYPGGKSVKVCFPYENKEIGVKPGTTAAEAIKLAGLSLEQPCGGRGKCGKCVIDIRYGDETKRTGACRERLMSDAQIIIPKIDNGIEGRTLSGERGKEYAAIIDIGTTTLEMSVLCGKTEIFTCSATNPQTKYSHDVIGRIDFAREHTELLHKEIVSAVNRMLSYAEEQLGISGFSDCVCSGNTVMQYLLRGINPKKLGVYPYLTEEKFNCWVSGEKIGLNAGRVYFPPVISAFVGGDISCGIAAVKLWERKNALLLDIGTNGEMAAYRNGRLLVTSAAAGPAFEGMNIKFGMRAAEGAIDSFRVINSIVSISTIDGAPAKGICGSGLLDIVSELVRNGITDENGTFADKDKCMSRLRSRLCVYKGEKAFSVFGEICITQSDIREVQLAKAAIRAGIECMAEGAEKLLLAGAFGKHMREDSLLACGILSEKFKGKTTAAGNTSLDGAIKIYLDADLREMLLKYTAEAKTVELNGNAEFEKLFVRYMNFNTD